VPYFLIAAMAAAETDCVAALADRLADLCVGLLPLKKVAAAFPLPRLTTVVVRHERTDADPGPCSTNSSPRPSVAVGGPSRGA
jgi:hypothetical protein